MSPKQFIIIGVSAAAALLSNSPLVAAIGSVAQHNTPTDDYPPQNGTSYTSTTTNLTHCHYRRWSAEGTLLEGLKIVISHSGLQTQRVRCPESSKHVAFSSAYDDDSGLSWFCLGTADNYGRMYSFGGSRTPRNTGRDPIRALNSSVLRRKIDRLYSAVTMIGSTTDLYEDDEEPPKTEARRFAIIALQEVCSAAIPVVKTLGTFEDLCVAYYKEAKGAVDVAQKTKGWSVTEFRGDTEISPPDE